MISRESMLNYECEMGVHTTFTRTVSIQKAVKEEPTVGAVRHKILRGSLWQLKNHKYAKFKIDRKDLKVVFLDSPCQNTRKMFRLLYD